MNEIWIGIVSAGGGALVVAIGSGLYQRARKRIRPSPEAETLAKVVPALNAVVSVQRPSLDVIIAMGVKTLGEDDANVIEAQGARAAFNLFLERSACIEVPDAS